MVGICYSAAYLSVQSMQLPVWVQFPCRRSDAVGAARQSSWEGEDGGDNVFFSKLDCREFLGSGRIRLPEDGVRVKPAVFVTTFFGAVIRYDNSYCSL